MKIRFFSLLPLITLTSLLSSANDQPPSYDEVIALSNATLTPADNMARLLAACRYKKTLLINNDSSESWDVTYEGHFKDDERTSHTERLNPFSTKIVPAEKLMQFCLGNITHSTWRASKAFKPESLGPTQKKPLAYIPDQLMFFGIRDTQPYGSSQPFSRYSTLLTPKQSHIINKTGSGCSLIIQLSSGNSMPLILMNDGATTKISDNNGIASIKIDGEKIEILPAQTQPSDNAIILYFLFKNPTLQAITYVCNLEE